MSRQANVTTTATRSSGPLDGRRLLVVDADRFQASTIRLVGERLGASDADEAHDLDGALDALGVASRRYDAVIVGYSTENLAIVAPLMKVLRAHRADLVVIAEGGGVDAFKQEPALAPQLAGCASVVTNLSATERIYTQLIEALHDGWTVRRIVDQRTVPTSLDEREALAIYGVPPGSRFHAPLD